MNFSKSTSGWLAAGLIALMGATRFYHFGTALHLPDASLAVFLLAGLWLRDVRWLAVLLLQAAAIDYLAITQFGVSDYCVTAGYAFLLPTYSLLWAAGRGMQRVCAWHLQAVIATAAVSAAFIVSNVGFYAFSGRYAELGAAAYAAEVAQYYLPYLTSAAIYLAPLALAAGLLRLRRPVLA